MATYKGIGYDSSTPAKIRTGTSSDDIAFDAQITANDGISATGGVSSDTITTTGDASVGGDLTVVGDIVSRGEVNLVIQDPVIDLGVGNQSTTSQAGGYALQMNRNSGFTAETATACTAGVNATSAPTITVSATTNFTAGDLLVFINSDQASNDGFYTVASASGTTITLEGVGGTAVSGSLPFSQNQLTTVATENADARVFKVDLYAQIVADGSANFNDGAGSAFAKGTLLEVFQANATKSDFTANGSYQPVGSDALSTSLQDAYNNGGGITTAGSNDIAFTLTAGDFTVDGGNVVLGGTSASNLTMDGGDFTAGATTALGAFAVQTNGNSGGDIVLSESGASGSIQIDVNSNTIVEVKDGALDLNSDIDFGKGTGSAQILKKTSVADGDDLTIQMAGANNASIILDNVAGTGNDAIKIDARTGGFDIAGELASKILVTTGALEVGTFTSGDLTLSTTTAGDIIANSAEGIDINASGALTMDGATFSLDATGASNVSATGGNLTVSTITSGNVTVSSVGELTLDSDDALFLKMDANDNTNKVLQVQANNAGTGQANIEIDADNNIFCQIAGTNVLEIASGGVIASQNLQASPTGGFKFGATGQVVSEIDTDTSFASASDGALATQLAIKTYVDNSVPSVDQDLNTAGDTGTGTINLATQTLTVNTGDNLTTSASGQAITINLDAVVDLGTSLAINGGQAITNIDTDGDLTANSNSSLPTQQAVKTYVDTATDVKVNTTQLTKAGATTINVGDVVAINSSGQAIQADASGASTATVVGIASFIDGNDVFVSQIGNNSDVSGLTAGTKYYLSKTAGGLTNDVSGFTAGDVVYQIGYAIGTGEIVIVPQFIMEIG